MRANFITPDLGMSRSKSKKKGTRRDELSPARAPEYTRFEPWVSAEMTTPFLGGKGRGKMRPKRPDAVAASGPKPVCRNPSAEPVWGNPSGGTRLPEPSGGRAASGRQDLNLRPPDPEPGALPD